MQSLIRSKSAGVTGGRGTAGAGPGRDLLYPALKRWAPPRRQGLCSHLAHFWATSDFAPTLKRWEPPSGRVYVATWSTCGPLLILPPALKRWGPSSGQGLCSHLSHLWAISDSAVALKRCGGKGYVATLPTCGPPLIFLPTLKRWRTPRRQGLCSHLAHLRATCEFAPRSEAVGPL